MLFGIDIAKIVNDAVAQSGGLETVTLQRVTYGARSSSNPAAGPTPSTSRFTLQGFASKVKIERWPATSLVNAKREIHFLAARLPAGITPQPGDVLIHGGKSSVVIEVMRDPARALFSCLVND